ncbi:hypothetical protein TKK_0007408 [Trichogramma kaykai]
MVFKILACALALVLVTSNSARAVCYQRDSEDPTGSTYHMIPSYMTLQQLADAQPHPQTQPESPPKPIGPMLRPLQVFHKDVMKDTENIRYVCSPRKKDIMDIIQCDAQSHTECLFEDFTPAPNCGYAITLGLNSTEKKAIVDLHNELRMKVARGEELRGAPGPQPAATNMQMLEWDDELAQTAQKWASQCQIGAHDECRKLPKFGKFVGQNVAFHRCKLEERPAEAYPVELARIWYEEVRYYNRSNVHRHMKNVSEDHKMTGHYAQFVWAQTNRIGCGWMYFYQDDFYQSILVCNYGPGGNIMGYPVYKTVK